MENYIGEISALLAGCCYALISVIFENASKRVGPTNVAVTRTIFGLIMLTLYNLIIHKTFVTILPIDSMIILSISGAIGFAIGDILLFESFLRLGARITMVIYSSVPFFTSVFAYAFLNDKMNVHQLIGMIVITLGIIMVVLKKDGNNFKINYSLVGISFAVLASLSQASVNILSKVGAKDYDPFSVTQIRMIAAIVTLIIICIMQGKLKYYKLSLTDGTANKQILAGAFFGPFLGVSLSLVAIQYINPGVAATLMSITPIILIPYEIFVKKQKLSKIDMLGTFIAFVGIYIMFV